MLQVCLNRSVISKVLARPVIQKIPSSAGLMSQEVMTTSPRYGLQVELLPFWIRCGLISAEIMYRMVNAVT